MKNNLIKLILLLFSVVLVVPFTVVNADEEIPPWHTWKQNEGFWKDDLIAPDKTTKKNGKIYNTIHDIGCIAVSVSILARRSETELANGKELHPGNFVSYALEIGAIDKTNGGLDANKTSDVFKDNGFSILKNGHQVSSDKVVSTVKDVSDKGNYTILMLRGLRIGDQAQHFVAVKGYDLEKQEIYIYDTQTSITTIKKGKETTESDFYSLDSIVTYSEYVSKNKKFNETKDEEITKSEDENNEDENNTENGGNISSEDELYDPFIRKPRTRKNQLAYIDDSTSIISDDFILSTNMVAESNSTYMLIVRFAIGGILLGYLIVCPIVYLAVLRGLVSPDKFKSFTGYDLSKTDEKNIMIGLFMRTILLSTFVGIILADLFVPFLSVIVSGVQFIIQLLPIK